ncbi:Ger(x)C family spore germination protein [Bacillaceae bacterium CLA-AA-H227]|uniref:Ger(X)C family spore germination protein n=1 Tax=Robertmurraya yapensis (ex Hitch et al 2024) TaxID=3133160 RepID=A0ACC6S6B8_9BACI
MKKIQHILFVFVIALTLTGCWDRTEVNDLAFITSTGIDKLEDNLFQVSIQVPLPSAMGGPSGGGGGTSGNKPYYVDSGIGRNVREANDDMQRRMSRELYFAHRRVIILGEKLASEGMERSLDLILEHPESRLSTFMLVAKGNAMDILTSSPHFEQIPAEAVRELTKTALKMNTREIINQLHLPGKDPIIPVVRTVTTQNNGQDEKIELQIDGAAILKDDVLQFMTNDQEALGISWLLKRMYEKKLTVSVRKESELNLIVEDYKLKPSYKINNKLPEFTISLFVDCNLLQNEPDLNLEDPDIYSLATRKIEEEIKKQVAGIINHAKSVGVDPYGLGWLVYRHDNKLWEENLSKNWRELLPDIKVAANVEAEIAVINNKGIKIREAT